MDPDMIVRFDDPIHSAFLRERIAQVFVEPHGMEAGNIFRVKRRFSQFDTVGEQEIARADVLHNVARSAHEFIARMFEHRPLVQYVRLSAEKAALSGARFNFEGKVDPEVIARIFGRPEEYVEVR